MHELLFYRSISAIHTCLWSVFSYFYVMWSAFQHFPVSFCSECTAVFWHLPCFLVLFACLQLICKFSSWTDCLCLISAVFTKPGLFRIYLAAFCIQVLLRCVQPLVFNCSLQRTYLCNSVYKVSARTLPDVVSFPTPHPNVYLIKMRYSHRNRPLLSVRDCL